MTDMEQIKNLLHKLSNQQDELMRNQNAMDKKMDALHNTVVGNEEYGHIGLVREVRDLKKYVDNDKKLKSRVSGGLVVVGVVWTLLLEFWKTIIK